MAEAKWRRRGDSRHRHNGGLQKSGGRKSMSLPYDLMLQDYTCMFHVAGRIIFDKLAIQSIVDTSVKFGDHGLHRRRNIRSTRRRL